MSENYLDIWSDPNRWIELEQEREAIGLGTRAMSLEAALAESVTATGSISGLDPSTMAIGFDVSHWNSQPDSFFWEAKEKLGLAFLIVKVSDGKQVRKGNSQDISNYVDDKCHRFIQLAYDLDIPCLVYHYYQPTVDQSPTKATDWQYRALNTAIGNLGPNKSYYGVVIDAEEKSDTVPNTSGEMIRFWNWLTDDDKYGQVFRPWYSSIGWFNWCTDLREWVGRKDANQVLWMAQWVFKVGLSATLDTLRGMLATVNMKVQTPGFADWKFLQVGVFNIGGGALDVDVYKGTKEQLYSWIGYVPHSEPEPEEPEPEEPVYGVVNVSPLNIRDDPSIITGEVMGALKKGAVVEILERVDDSLGNEWLHVNIDAFIAGTYNGKVYVKED